MAVICSIFVSLFNFDPRSPDTTEAGVLVCWPVKMHMNNCTPNLICKHNNLNSRSEPWENAFHDGSYLC